MTVQTGSGRDAMAAISADPILDEAYQHWITRCPGKIPARREIDPTTLPPRIIPYLVLAEYEDDQGTVIYRIVGDQMVRRFGRNFTGCRLTETAQGTYFEFLQGIFRQSLRSRRPIYSESVFRWDADGWAHTRRVMMPLADVRDGRITHSLIAQTWPTRAEDQPRTLVVEVPSSATGEHFRVEAL